jgi:uncharacterized membrane protein YfcA
MHARVAPLSACLAALICGAGILAALPVLLVGAEVDQRFARPIALATCGVVAVGFAYLWPTASWRWGVWLSAALWLFFGFVFAALWWNGMPDWFPLVDAVAALAAGCAGAALGAWLARRRRTPVA